ncbi:hypothetical protein NDN08_006948 [Rhodosorus marinus]|uniref:BZIP domain-containing protein n=1 Tax=Rhodosorus marinus TaxID=101924 RepID=A0AAV8UJ62_9RHOD|nr:hypothetical protein NDN08_006948 [Rhodosorus marinus]
MRKELQPLPLGKLPPPKAGLRKSSGDKITVPLERGGDDLSASLRMFSPSAFNRTPLSAGTPTSFLSRFVGLSPSYSKHSDFPLPQLTPDSRKRMSNIPTPTERALPLKRPRQSSHLEPVMTVDSLDDPLKNDSNLYSPLLNDLSALKNRRLLEPLLTPLRPPESRNHQRIRDGEWEMSQLPWQRGSDSQIGGDEQRDLLSPPGIHALSRQKRSSAESVLAGLPQPLSGIPSKVTSETINDYRAAAGEEKHGSRVMPLSGDGGSGSAMKDLPDEGDLSMDAGNHQEVHSTGLPTREASGNRQKTEAMSIREQGLGEQVDLPRSGASDHIGYSALPTGPNSCVPSEVRTLRPTLDSSNGVGLRMPAGRSPTIASAAAPSMVTTRTPTLVSAPTTVTPPVITPTMITPPAPSAIHQPAPAGVDHAAHAGVNQAAPPGMNQAAPPGMNQAALPGMSQAALAGMNQAAPAVSNVAPQSVLVAPMVPVAPLMGIPANGMAVPPVNMLPWAPYQAPVGKAAIPGLKRSSLSQEPAGYDRSRTMASNDAKPKVVRNREAALKSRTAAKAKMEKLEQCNAELKDAVDDLIRKNDALRKALES